MRRKYTKLFEGISVAIIVAAFALSAKAQTTEYKNGGNIRFGKGRTSSIVKGSVRPNQEISYSIRAREGQKILVTLSSPQSSTTFSLYAVRGEMLAQFQRSFRGYLPEAVGNEYVLSVYTEARSSTFSLSISVK